MGKKSFIKLSAVVGLGGLLLLGCASGLSSRDVDADPLYRQFVDPPASAKPRVWWHWLNGNVTQEGIKQDLAWMRRIGIGGFQNFDASLMTPKVVDERLVYMTPPWIDAMRLTADLAESSNLEMAIASSPGWSVTGGPWVDPAQAMKKLVWSELEIEGGKPFRGKLAQPPSVSGPFQDRPQAPTLMGSKPPIHFYADAAVIAYPVSADARTPAPSISVTGGQKIDSKLLSDGSLAGGVKLQFGSQTAPTCIGFDYRRSTSIASLVMAAPVGTDFFHSPTLLARLEASNDGIRYRKIAEIPAGKHVQHTITFPAVAARHFRVCSLPPPPPHTDLLEAPAPGANLLIFSKPPKAPETFEIYELTLHHAPRVNRAEAKAGFTLVPDYYAAATPKTDANQAVSPEAVTDLSDRMAADGTLDWQPPPGRWKVVRFGYSLTGRENQPASPEATGLEVDKLDPTAVRNYLDTYLGKYEAAVGKDKLGEQGIKALLVDSYEAGIQNWTPSLPKEFLKRRGYALLPWMPALTGTIVGDAAKTDAFLYDFRRTIAELFSENHYGQIAQAARARGMVQYGEALEQGRPALGDDMEMRRHAGIPMAAMWTFSPQVGVPTPARFADIRGAASVAHIYGQNLVAAEALTSAFAPWAHAPRDLKPMIDLAFAVGVNRPVIHTSVHQPLNKVPGLTLLLFGQHFTRNETWAEQAGPWITYLARTSHLLQQGRFAADVLYFYGEEAPLTALYQDALTPDAPENVGFDFANADVLLNRVQVDRGDLVTASGMRYRFLYLGGSSDRMTLAVLRRIAQLVEEGATVVGQKPMSSPSLADDPVEFVRIANQLWSGASSGAGRVIPARDMNAALARLGVSADFEYRKPQPDSQVMFLHRHLDDGEIYFLSNRRAREEHIEASFRVAGKRPELWFADDGRKQAVSYRIAGGRTQVPLTLKPNEAVFVVFREPAVAAEETVIEPQARVLAGLSGEWEVSFQAGRGAPTTPLKMTQGSWSVHDNPQIRYFSGTAVYRKDVAVPQGWLGSNERILLDLGEVRDLVEVFVNDRSLGVLWHPPYRVDVTQALRAGNNRVELRVTNLWANRLIGDAQPGAEKLTFTTYPPYLPDAPLRTSGLIGPVVFQSVGPRAAAPPR